MRIPPSSASRPSAGVQQPAKAEAPAQAEAPKKAEAGWGPGKAAAAAAVGAPTATAAQVVTAYYEAMNKRDFAALEKLYSPMALFRDNVFKFDDARGIIGMWKKLPPDAQVKHELVRVENGSVTAKIAWDYTLFGNKVHNEEQAHFTVRDGRITLQREQFDFAEWGHQAFPFLPKALLKHAEPWMAPLLRLIA